MDRDRRPPFRDDSVRGEHAYDPHASPTEMRRLSGGLAGLYTEPALALDFGTYRPRDVLTFPANKDRTWRLPTELDPVRLMHNAIRAEVTKFEALLFKLGDAKLSGWQIQCIKVRHDPTRLLIFLLEFVSILLSRGLARANKRAALHETRRHRRGFPHGARPARWPPRSHARYPQSARPARAQPEIRPPTQAESRLASNLAPFFAPTGKPDLQILHKNTSDRRPRPHHPKP